MAKNRCPRCHKYMFHDFNLNFTYCLHCGYNVPSDDDVIWATLGKQLEYT